GAAVNNRVNHSTTASESVGSGTPVRCEIYRGVYDGGQEETLMIRSIAFITALGCTIASTAAANDYSSLSASSAGLSLDTVARDISGDTVVGYGSVGSGHYKAFIYDGSNYTAFNYPSAYQTYATGIDGNKIVGHYEPDAASFSQRGFLY